MTSGQHAGPLSVGASIAGGRYRLLRLLGAGGMATVWLADDATLAREVAVKAMADTLAADPGWVRRFEREARAAAALNHPNVVPVFDYGSELGRPYLVMQYISGGSLAAPERRVPVAVEALARELLNGLAHIHAAGLVHRDIKPANVLIDGDGRARITDFGIAQPRDATSLTRTGTVLGTAAYLAPEVLAGRPATVRSDLFSCGRLLEHAAAGARGAGIDRVIAALSAVDPGRRPASARAALELLEEPAGSTRPQAVARPAHGGAPSTAYTHVLDASAGARPSAAGARGRRAASPSSGAFRLPSRRPLLGALALAALLAVLVLVAGGAGGSAPAGGKGLGAAPAPAPASSGAPLRRQLQALGRRLAYAAGR